MVISLSLVLIVSALPSIPTSSPNYFNCTFDPIYQEDGTRDVWCNFTDSSSDPILNANISHSTYDTNDWYKNGLMSEKGWFIGYQSVPNAYNFSDENFTVYSSRTIDSTRRAHIKYGAFTYPFNHISQNFSILLKAGSGATTLRVMVCNSTYANDVMGNTPVNLTRTSLYDGCQLAGTINATTQGINYNNWTWGTVDVTSAYNNMTANQIGAMDYAIHISSYDNASINPVGWSIAGAWMPPIHNETKEVFTLNESDFYTPNENIIPTGCSYTIGTNMTGSVLHLRLNEASGTLDDVSCQSNDGTAYDSPSLGDTGLFVNATNFTSEVDSRIVVADDDSLDLNETGTLMTWINLNSLSPYSGFIHKGQENSFSDEAYSFQFGSTGNTLKLYLTDGSNDIELDAASTLDTDKWYHVVATWNSTTKKIYIDGVEDITTESTILPQTTTGSLQIGAQLDEPYFYGFGHFSIDGKLDEVNIFNRTLTADEIDGFYKKGLNYFTPDNRTYSGATEVYGNDNLLFASDTITFNETTNYPIFDSDDDYLEPLNYSSYEGIRNSSFTNCLYFKRSETSSDLRRLVRWDGAYELSIQSDDIRMTLRARSPYYKITIGTVGDLVDDTEWHHVCGIRDKENEEIKIILDGEKMASAYFDGSRELSVTDFDITDNANVIGRDTPAGGNDNGFRG